MNLLESARIGIIFRTFAGKQSQMEERVKLVKEAVDKALQLSHNNRPIFYDVSVLVPSNPAFASIDCGQMVEELRLLWKGQKRVRIHKSDGDLFCGTLNQGVASQSESGVKFSLIASPDAHSYLTKENVMAMLERAEAGAKVVGLAINELHESIHQGRVANTFCLWHNRSLMTVGGFNLLSAEPENDQRAHFLEGRDANGTQVFYKINGVEEVIPAALLVKHYGRCIAIVDPVGEGQEYQVVSDPDVRKRHIAKMATKHQRQDELLSLVRLDASMLANGIMA